MIGIPGPDEIAEAGAANIVYAMVRKAQGGNVQAARLILDRVWPERPARHQIDLRTDMKTVADAEGILASLLAMVAMGRLAPQETVGFTAIVREWLHARELGEVEERLTKLENGGAR